MTSPDDQPAPQRRVALGIAGRVVDGLHALGIRTAHVVLPSCWYGEAPATGRSADRSRQARDLFDPDVEAVPEHRQHEDAEDNRPTDFEERDCP